MEDKIKLLKQLGFSDEYINYLSSNEPSGVVTTLDESKSNVEFVDIKNNDVHGLIIERAGMSQNVSFIINQH